MRARVCVCVPEEVMLAEEDKHAEEKSPMDGAWYKRKQNNPGEACGLPVGEGPCQSGCSPGSALIQAGQGL